MTVMLEWEYSIQKTSKRRILDGLASLMHSGYAFFCITHTNPSKILRLDVFFMLYPYISFKDRLLIKGLKSGMGMIESTKALIFLLKH